jgi:hypothetical protein
MKVIPDCTWWRLFQTVRNTIKWPKQNSQNRLRIT